MSNIKSFIEKRMPFYGVVFNFEPPTDAQLQAEVNRVTMRMVKAFTIGNVVAIACAVIAYNTAFTDTGESFQVFNPLCAIPLLVGFFVLFYVKIKTNKLKALREDFLPSTNQTLASMNPHVNEYLQLVEEKGRTYITNYENSRLFDFSQSRMEL